MSFRYGVILALTLVLAPIPASAVSASYDLLFQTREDRDGGNEIAILTYLTFADLVADNAVALSLLSIDVSPGFTTTGFAAVRPAAEDRPGAVVPLPPTFLLLATAILFVGVRRRRSRRGAGFANA